MLKLVTLAVVLITLCAIEAYPTSDQVEDLRREYNKVFESGKEREDEERDVDADSETERDRDRYRDGDDTEEERDVKESDNGRKRPGVYEIPSQMAFLEKLSGLCDRPSKLTPEQKRLCDLYNSVAARNKFDPIDEIIPLMRV